MNFIVELPDEDINKIERKIVERTNFILFIDEIKFDINDIDIKLAIDEVKYVNYRVDFSVIKIKPFSRKFVFFHIFSIRFLLMFRHIRKKFYHSLEDTIPLDESEE
ncbi:MAG: hypothetical protein J6A04_07765 [Clostridia bacterium]|nr:hypothetical protein [Clostridia bacterium]